MSLTPSLPLGKVAIFEGAPQHFYFKNYLEHGALRHIKKQSISCPLQGNKSLVNTLGTV